MFLFSATILHPEWSLQNTNLTVSPFDKNYVWFSIVLRKETETLVAYNFLCDLFSAHLQTYNIIFWAFLGAPSELTYISSLNKSSFPHQDICAGCVSVWNMLAKLATISPHFPTSSLPSVDCSSFRPQVKCHYFKETYFDTSNLLVSLSSTYLLFNYIFIFTVLW